MSEPAMPLENAAEAKTPPQARALWLLAGLAALSFVLYLAIAVASLLFQNGSPCESRPIILVIGLFAVLFVLYLWGIQVAVRTRTSRGLLALIFISSIGFRILLLPSVPIQEIDIYRYIWDGAVTQAGVSPFRYSPQQVREASGSDSEAASLAKLVRLRDSDATLARILNRVHYGEVPSVYPPVSQAVFAAAALSTPHRASLNRRLVTMKAWLVMFDVGTVILLVGLLSRAGRPVGLAIAYAWCPLVLKEFANSGHLDAVAVFLTTLGIYLMVKATGQGRGVTAGTDRGPWAMVLAPSAAIALALAVGAKLYPIVLTPLMLFWSVRRFGWRRTLPPAIAFCVAVTIVMWPMLPNHEAETNRISGRVSEGAGQGGDPSSGLQTFLCRWEMNDFLFLLIVENLKPSAAIPEGHQAWFQVTPEPFRQAVAHRCGQRLGVEQSWEASFLVARCITAAIFFAAAIWIAALAAHRDSVDAWCEAIFLTIAWFWLLCPTQNPWYWTWCLPFVPFARSRLWLWVSGLTMIYYLRFWLQYHFADSEVLGTGYTGAPFFDLVVTWIEFGPWLLALVAVSLLRKFRSRCQQC